MQSKNLLFSPPLLKWQHMEWCCPSQHKAPWGQETSMWGLLKLNYSNPKGDCDLCEVEEKKLLSNPKTITTYSDFPQSNQGEKHNRTAIISLKILTLWHIIYPSHWPIRHSNCSHNKLTLERDLTVGKAERADFRCLNPQLKLALLRRSKKATPLIIHVAHTVCKILKTDLVVLTRMLSVIFSAASTPIHSIKFEILLHTFSKQLQLSDCIFYKAVYRHKAINHSDPRSQSFLGTFSHINPPVKQFCMSITTG